ncbi:hypothetical protein L218DRAFT_973007 [Marasmius fiardii PR-910]|nr:hypothetical protein L218DRAFT_973007 [Marasmius fiardii PR-910]
MTTAPSTNRASLLSGLRTGGVRSVSATVPHTAAPGATFNVPRAASHSFPEEEEDQVLEMPSRNIYANNHHGASHIMPMTAAVDAPNNRFAQQQRTMNPNSIPFSPAFNPNVNPQQQAFQMQMMQLELMKLQAAQQYQTELMAQAQRQQQQQNRRSSYNPPATAGPFATGFDIHSATVSAQMRRANEQQQQQMFKSQLAVSDDYVPMTAALGGKFGSRTNFAGRPDEDIPSHHGSTTVISGGISLGNPSSNNTSGSNVPSKSDAATSWRRGGKGNSVLNGANRAVTSPSVKVTPPEPERVSPLTTSPTTKNRPQPLRFSSVTQQPLPTVTIDSSDGNDNDDTSSTSSSKSGASNSSPTTPQSPSSNETPLSPREEASKKLYEGLGVGRPGSVVAVAQQPYGSPPNNNNAVLVSHRLVSQPTRQPRGPPSGADELGPKNFATRIRRKAIGGLGMLMDARERREVVEAF